MNARTLLRFALLLVLEPILAGTCGFAQPEIGETVLTALGSKAGLFYETSTRPFRVMLPIAGGHLRCVKMAPDNSSLYCGTATVPRQILRITAKGGVSTLATLPDGYYPLAMEFDQTGDCMITAYKAGSISAIFRLSQSTLTTWASATGSTWRGLCREFETGDFVVGDWTTGRLLRIDHYTRKVTTIASGLGAITGVAYVPRSGRFAVTRGSHANGLVIVRSDGHVTNEIPLANAEAVSVREDTGDIHACGYGMIVSVSDLGSVRSTHAWPGYVFTGIEVYGKRPLSLTASGRLGAKQNVKIRFTRSPGALYVCALSFAHRPGLAIGHDRVLHLRPDALFQLTLGRDILGITERFIGITHSGTGSAYPAFTLPASFPHGICIYVAGAALNPTFPGGLEFSNTGVVRTWTAVVRPLPLP